MKILDERVTFVDMARCKVNDDVVRLDLAMNGVITNMFAMTPKMAERLSEMILITLQNHKKKRQKQKDLSTKPLKALPEEK